MAFFGGDDLFLQPTLLLGFVGVLSGFVGFWQVFVRFLVVIKTFEANPHKEHRDANL